MQHLTEVLTESPIVPGSSVAHRRGSGLRPSCMPTSSQRWVELSAGRALELGAVPCAEKACAEVTA